MTQPVNYCDVCGKVITRKRRASGCIESINQYMARITCGPGTACYTAQKRATAFAKQRKDDGAFIAAPRAPAFRRRDAMDAWLYQRGAAHE